MKMRVLIMMSFLLLLFSPIATAAKDVKTLNLPQLIDSSSCKVVDPDNLIEPYIRKEADGLLRNIDSAYHILSSIVVIDRLKYNEPDLTNVIFSHYNIKPGDDKMVAVITVHPCRFEMVSGDENFKDWWYENAVKDALKDNNPDWAVASLSYAFNRYFPNAFTDAQLPILLNGKKNPKISLYDEEDGRSNAIRKKGWTAQNIILPHLRDSKRYVSNPERLLSDDAENVVNQIMWKMDKELGVESAVVVVSYVKNRQIYKMAQGLFDKYGIGRDNRGLVIILAYEDHLLRTHTGKYLESDLPDVVCARLQREYAIPAMENHNPDAGMINLTRAIYHTLKGEEVPDPDDDQLIPKDYKVRKFTGNHTVNILIPSFANKYIDLLPGDSVKHILAFIILLPFMIGYRLGKCLKDLRENDEDEKSHKKKVYCVFALIVGLILYVCLMLCFSDFDSIGTFLFLFSICAFCGYIGLKEYLPKISGDRDGDGGGGGYGGGGSGGGGATSSW